MTDPAPTPPPATPPPATPPPATPAAGRDAIVIDVDDRPIPVLIAGRLFEFQGTLTAGQIATTLDPIRRRANALQAADAGADDAGGLAELADAIMAGLADLLADQTRRDDWLALQLPLPALIATDRPSVLGSLMNEWTGRPLGSA